MEIIYINGLIGWDVTAASFKADLDAANGSDVEIHINTPGGGFSDGLAIFNMIAGYTGKTIVRLVGLALSMGSYLPMAADEVIAEDNAVFMIHNARGLAGGDHKEVLKFGAFLKSLSGLAAKAYSRKTGEDLATIAGLMDETTYYFGSEIEEAGFADATNNSGEDLDKNEATALAVLAFDGMGAKMFSDSAAVKKDLSLAAEMVADGGFKFGKKKASEMSAAEKNGGSKKMDIAKLKSDFPGLVKTIQDETRAAMTGELDTARLEGATGERSRILEIGALTMPGHEDLIASLVADGKTSGQEAAVMVLKAEKARIAAIGGNLEADAIDQIPNPDAAAGASAAAAGAAANADTSVAGLAKKKWDADPKTQAEFGGDYDAYLAVEMAGDAGLLKIKTDLK